jgi:hypothetical protein
MVKVPQEIEEIQEFILEHQSIEVREIDDGPFKDVYVISTMSNNNRNLMWCIEYETDLRVHNVSVNRETGEVEISVIA